jgi:hypothetical protein
MAQRDEPFLAWLSEQAGPLNALQSKVVLTALIELLHLAPPAVRRDTHGFFSKFWTATYLGGGGELDRIAKKVRGPIRLGRPPTPLDQLRADYHAVLAWAEGLCSTNPTLTQFRRALDHAQKAGVIPTGRLGPIPVARVPRLYPLHEKPQHLALAVLHLVTEKTVKTIREQIRPKPASPQQPRS